VSQHYINGDGDLYVGDVLTFVPVEFWLTFEEWYGDKAYRHLHFVEDMWRVAKVECEEIRMNNM